LWFDFNKQDHDGDGLLNPTEFAHFIWDLGLEFDDVYTLKAFNMIDKDRDRKITFEEFRVWWMKSSFQAAPRDKRANFENPYHRFD
jgi:Ca2+-binding EF-hand superfamily protein